MIANIEEKHINNPNSYKNRKNLLEKFFSEAKKLTIKTDFKISDLVSEKESFIVIILIYSILDEKISTNYPNLIEDSQIIQQKNDNLITFMLSRCFKYHKIEIYFDHKIQPKSYTKIKIPSLRRGEMKIL